MQLRRVRVCWEDVAGSVGAGQGRLRCTAPHTITVAMMDSSASLKLSMRWECWVLSSSSFLVPVGESPSMSMAGSGVRGLDMVGPEKKHRSEHAGVLLGGCPCWLQE